MLTLSFNPVSPLYDPNTVLSDPDIFTENRFRLETDDNHVIQFYTPNYYSHLPWIEFLSYLVLVLSVAAVLIAISTYFIDGVNSKQILIALENVFLAQFTYFSLMASD